MTKKFTSVITQTNSIGVSRIIMNDAKTYNSLSTSMLKTLIKCFKVFNKDKKTKYTFGS